jgi:hypothetical protein
MIYIFLSICRVPSNDRPHSLHAFIRSCLASGGPELAANFREAARNHLRETYLRNPPQDAVFFVKVDSAVVPTPDLNNALAQACTLFGAGLGFASLGILASSIGLKWMPNSEMSDTLAVMNIDICLALQVSFPFGRQFFPPNSFSQSSREELDHGWADLSMVHTAIADIHSAVKSSFEDTKQWKGGVSAWESCDEPKVLDIMTCYNHVTLVWCKLTEFWPELWFSSWSCSEKCVDKICLPQFQLDNMYFASITSKTIHHIFHQLSHMLKPLEMSQNLQRHQKTS